jgi:hypothetical protein
VEIRVPLDASLVCLVGENGTGKSNILELLAATAHFFGLTPSMGRNPLAEPHSVTLHMRVPERVPGSESLMADIVGDQAAGWTGELIFTSHFDGQTGQQDLRAEGVSDSTAHNVASMVVNALRHTEETNLGMALLTPPVRDHAAREDDHLGHADATPARRAFRVIRISSLVLGDLGDGPDELPGG